MAALRSPRDSLNTPKMLTTPSVKDDMLSTPTLTTPRTADWGSIFSPVRLSSCASSPSITGREPREPPELPLDSSIGLSSPHDGLLAKRRKLKHQNSGAKSVESDSNSCDTPDSMPKDLSNHCETPEKQDENRPTDLRTNRRLRPWSPGQSGGDLDVVRDRVGAVNITSSPKGFKHPIPRSSESRHPSYDPRVPDHLRLSHKDDGVPSYHPSPLVVPSPNWTTINDFMSEGLAQKTPKVLDNFVFDVLPPNTPNTPKIREKSPESMYDRHFDRRVGNSGGSGEERRPRTETRVTFANQPKMVTLTPPPTYPQDLSLRGSTKQDENDGGGRQRSYESPPAPLRHSTEDDMMSLRHQSMEEIVIPKQEMEECMRDSSVSPANHRPGSTSPINGDIKEEPREFSNIPPGFPPYYLHPGITPGQVYRGMEESVRQQPSPPASPPCVPPAIHHFYQQPRPSFYQNFNLRHPAMLYEQHQSQNSTYLWSQQHTGGHPPPWVTSESSGHSPSSYLKPGLLPVKTENHRLSTDSPDLKNKQRRPKEEDDMEKDGAPPKKRGKGKGKGKDPNGPKRVFVCPHCQRSYDWNYNLNRHLKYECGKENSFMCSKCGRRFPHKQNCVYHLKRKHKIMCDTVDQYVTSGLVVYQGPSGAMKDNSSPGEQHVYSPPTDSEASNQAAPSTIQ